MQCPVCSGENLMMMERQGVEIDYCPKCRGVWLDRGELDKIIERSSAVEPQHTQKQGRDQKSSGGYGYQKRKKSILSEIFDF